MKGYITTISMLAVLLISGTKLVSAGDGPPSNDIFANAVPMVIENGTASVTTTNMEATKEPGEPNHAENAGGRSVWFKVTPVATTVLRINTTNNSFDTLLAVYTGDSVNNLTTVSFNDDCNNACGFASAVDVMVTAGTTYYIAVDGYNDLGTPSAGTFKIGILETGVPFQDDLQAAYNLGSSHAGSLGGTNFNATRQTGEPNHYNVTYPGAKSVWYRWSPSADFSAMFELTEGFDSQIAVYSATTDTPTLAQLTRVTDNLDFFGYTDSRYRVKFFAENNKFYFIAVAGITVAGQIPEGNFQLRFRPNKLRYEADYEGRDDDTAVTVFRPSDGTWYSINGFGQSPNYVDWGMADDTPVPADYDGNGVTDRAVARNLNGAKYWYINSAPGSYAIQWGLATDKAVTGDFDCDGRADPVAIRSPNGNLVWYVRQSSNGALRTFTFGISLIVEKPVMGDFDGDGCTDVALTRNVGGEQFVMNWYILKSNHGAYNQYTSLQFGVPGDFPATGDFDGDGKSDVAVFRPANGTWYIFRSGSGQVQVTQFGSNGDKPQPGDFDGDGKADLGVFRPSEGNWYMWLSGSDTQKIIRWGLSTDIPVATMNSLSQ